MSITKVGQFAKTGGEGENRGVEDAVKAYNALHAGGWSAEAKAKTTDMVNKYYDLATSFYEFGWGESFHFAHRLKGETLRDSLKRHEHHLALRGGFQRDQKVRGLLEPCCSGCCIKISATAYVRGHGAQVLDLGCGVGGPAREICRVSGARVTGINNNAHQVKRATELTAAAGRFVAGRCTFVQADFMALPCKDSEYDGAYAIEATCHAPDAAACYREIARTLKPGGMFVCYEWCLTRAYNSENPEHERIRKNVEIGNGLPGIRTTAEVDAAVKAAGLELLTAQDLVESAEVPWFFPIDATAWRWEMPQTTALGRRASRTFAWCLERIGIAPRGTSEVSDFLEKGADGLCEGGRTGIFTPLYLIVARKPGGGK